MRCHLIARHGLQLRVLLGFLSFFFVLEEQAQQKSAPLNANTISLAQGTVEIRRRTADNWRPAKLNDLLAGGDQVRTGERSRAEVALVSGTVIKLGAQSELQVPPVEDESLRRGIFQIFNRERTRGFNYRMPGGATAAIRGTDFFVEVSEQQVTLGVLDGAVTLANAAGSVDLSPGDSGTARPGQQPVKARLDLNDPALVQWSFYYPAVLNLRDLRFAAEEQQALNRSFDAYRAGDLPEAFRTYPWELNPASDAERCYRAELLLSVGQVNEAFQSLQTAAVDAPGKDAVLVLIAAVRRDSEFRTNAPASSSEWLASSYYLQSRGDLEGARTAAREAARQGPDFGFAWARLGELEFGFADRKAVRTSLDKALALSPRNAHAVALHGFLLAAEGHIAAGEDEFSRAIELDSSYANGWLGRGLCRIRQRQDQAGQEDLFVAATLEPKRAIYRSYLGKAFQEIGDDRHARKELDVAKRLDPNDPTAWLYAALLDALENRDNSAIRDLEHSEELVENRRLFRSQLLLDEDRAVRGANLAAIYRDVGLQDVSVREAAEAVRQDYANFSAHLFLANSYNELRDASLANLRYETATFSEYLLANLLSPVGGTPLSQQVSQQEYARLFERDRLGFASQTTYLSSGQWQQDAAQYGVWGNFAYALEGSYRTLPGDAPNADLKQYAGSLQLKEQVTPEDSAYLQLVYNHVIFGDVFQYFDPASADRSVRNDELQQPNLFAGWHHQWSPGVHTLFLFSNLRDQFTSEQLGRINTLLKDARGAVTNTFGGVGAGNGELFGTDYRSDFEAFGAELQQIWHTPEHTFIVGARAQHGEVDTRNNVVYKGGFLQAGFYDFVVHGNSLTETPSSTLDRWTGYGYWQWQVAEPFSVMSGLTLDKIRFPENSVSPPITADEREKDQLSPKAGFTWTPNGSSTIRGAYSRSLGGLFYDSSVRLEPVEVAGFNQVFRSIAPESVGGIVPGTEFETWDIGSEHRLASHTYFGWQGELLRSQGDRTVGVFSGQFIPFTFGTFFPAQEEQIVKYRERSLSLYLNQLLGEEWSLGARYRLTDSAFNLQTPAVSTSAWPEGASDRGAVLHQLSLYALYNHPSGWFAGTQALWTLQNNERDDAALGQEEFWQFNCYAGYRWPRRRAEITVGLLNIANQDYRLNPVSLYTTLPRERTFFTSLRLNL